MTRLVCRIFLARLHAAASPPNRCLNRSGAAPPPHMTKVYLPKHSTVLRVEHFLVLRLPLHQSAAAPTSCLVHCPAFGFPPSCISARASAPCRPRRAPTHPQTHKMFEKVVVVDCRAHMMGRLASVVAKELLNGQRVVLVRCEAINISGSRKLRMSGDQFKDPVLLREARQWVALERAGAVCVCGRPLCRRNGVWHRCPPRVC